jgi:hypothetical protein
MTTKLFIEIIKLESKSLFGHKNDIKMFSSSVSVSHGQINNELTLFATIESRQIICFGSQTEFPNATII